MLHTATLGLNHKLIPSDYRGGEVTFLLNLQFTFFYPIHPSWLLNSFLKNISSQLLSRWKSAASPPFTRLTTRALRWLDPQFILLCDIEGVWSKLYPVRQYSISKVSLGRRRRRGRKSRDKEGRRGEGASHTKQEKPGEFRKLLAMTSLKYFLCP